MEGGSLRKGTSSSCGCQAKKAVRPHTWDAKSMQSETQEIFNLIAQGYLPPADQFSAIDGSPCWSLRSIAVLLGLKLDELEQQLLIAGRRFNANGSVFDQAISVHQDMIDESADTLPASLTGLPMQVVPNQYLVNHGVQIGLIQSDPSDDTVVG